MKGSYINIWIQKGAKSKKEPETVVPNGGFENPAFNKSGSECNELVSLGFAPIEDRVDDLLHRFGIEFVVKTESNFKSRDVENNSEVRILLQIFVPEKDLENILIGLQKAGVGVVAGTGFSLLPTTVNIFGEDEASSNTSVTHSHSQSSHDSGVDTVDGGQGAKHDTSHNPHPFKQYKIEKFYRSIKSRLIVAEVIKRIEGGAEFSFDFVCFLVVAACLAFMGLVENSSVVLVASMLVSPLMGPILAIVFGTAVRNRKLVKIGVAREFYCLLICIICGFIFGCVFVTKFNRTRSMLAITTSNNWPTTEMASRTGWSCLVVGLAIAVPSGVGVAISVLGGNSGSMVGVAISASLLPPAVNTGLYWAMAMMSYGFDDSLQQEENSVYSNETLKQTKDFVFEYAEHGDIPLELFWRGMISLTLTCVNIVCIVMVGVLMLLVKQVTPESIPQRNASFWKNDILLNKEYEKSFQENEGGPVEDMDLSDTFIASLFEEASKDKDVIDRRDWIERNMCTFNEVRTDSPIPSVGRFQVIPILRNSFNKFVRDRERSSGHGVTFSRRTSH